MHRVFLLPCWPQVHMEGYREAGTTNSSDNFQLVHYCIVEEVNFVDEEFLYKKMRNKDVYVVYGATGDIPEDGFS